MVVLQRGLSGAVFLSSCVSNCFINMHSISHLIVLYEFVVQAGNGNHTHFSFIFPSESICCFGSLRNICVPTNLTKEFNELGILPHGFSFCCPIPLSHVALVIKYEKGSYGHPWPQQNNVAFVL